MAVELKTYQNVKLPPNDPKTEKEAFQLLKKTGSLKHLVGKVLPYFPWIGLKFPVEVDLQGLVDVMQIVNDEWIRWKMPSSRINQMTSVKNGIKQMLREDPSLTQWTFEYKDAIRGFMEFAIFALLGELNIDYAPYTRNEDIMYGMINAWTRKKEWPIVCSAAMMVVKHHSFDWGRLKQVEYSNLHHQTWMRRECWKEWRNKSNDAVYPMRNDTEEFVQIEDSNLKKEKSKKQNRLTNNIKFKKKAAHSSTSTRSDDVPVCKYFKRWCDEKLYTSNRMMQWVWRELCENEGIWNSVLQRAS